MANTILLPYTISTNSPHTPKRRHWRRYTTTMTINTNQKLHSSPPFVHNSTPNLPDIVNDCHQRQHEISTTNEQIKLTCKEIAHSLRLVADQVDRKYCQVSVNSFSPIDILHSLFFLFRMLISIEIFNVYPSVLYYIQHIFAPYSTLYGHDRFYHFFSCFARQNHSCNRTTTTTNITTDPVLRF